AERGAEGERRKRQSRGRHERNAGEAEGARAARETASRRLREGWRQSPDAEGRDRHRRQHLHRDQERPQSGRRSRLRLIHRDLQTAQERLEGRNRKSWEKLKIEKARA